MPNAIDNLEPKPLFDHFAALSAIPRASTKEAAARAYVLARAARLGLETVEDSVGNIVVRKPARPGREGAVPAALQGHLDMVCEKNEGTVHNFDTDAIQLVRDGDWLKAAGTTLGADNGIGAAAALAIMESTTVNHGPLEFVFTVDEETGLTGANEFPNGMLRSHYFLNLDGEEENTLCIGCAGGLTSIARRQFTMIPASAGSALRLRVAGLHGGHSGIDIHKGRGNAIRILGRVLARAIPQFAVSVASLEGGSKRNAIPREAAAIVVIDPGRAAEFAAFLATAQAEIQAELGAFDPGLRLTAEAAPAAVEVFESDSATLLAQLLATLHHGALAMSPDVAGLVQTSTNLATISTTSGLVEIATTQRSAILSSKLDAGAMVSAVFGFAGFEVQQSGAYPGWKPEPNSDIVRKCQAVHEEILGVKPELVAMHAGLECGVIGEKHPGMQLISFGPHIVDVHSPSERLKLSSVPPFWAFLTGLLERL
ncbi:MAG: beta-Ala-His dipeptidase [Acidobacteria bacterium]|nr:beta-Ala-His dipeptidase [Acidobacteriota bacterium]